MILKCISREKSGSMGHDFPSCQCVAWIRVGDYFRVNHFSKCKIFPWLRSVTSYNRDVLLGVNSFETFLGK